MKVEYKTELTIIKRKDINRYQTEQYRWPQIRGEHAKRYAQYSGALSQTITLGEIAG
jgi:hypothetical protein